MSNILDATLDEIKNSRFRVKFHGTMKKIEKWSSFTSTEVQCLLMVYYKLCLASGSENAVRPNRELIAVVFMEQFEIIDEFMIISIIDHFAQGTMRVFTAESWVEMIEMMMCDDLEKQMKFVYDIYLSRVRIGLNQINREAVTEAVKIMFIGDDDDDEINEIKLDMVDQLFTKFDLDKDGVISFEEYATVVRKQPYLMEFLGRCLPPSLDTRTVIAFCFNVITKLNFC